MPTIPKTSTENVLAAARAILEEGGEQSLTMQEVARRVGIRGPSLYKRFSDRNALLSALEEQTFDRLRQAVSQSDTSLKDIAEAYISFAQANPVAYGLLFKAGDPTAALRSARPTLEKMEAILGDADEALLRTRILTSFIHGYFLIDSWGGFRLGGDTSEIVAKGLALIVPEAFRSN